MDNPSVRVRSNERGRQAGDVSNWVASSVGATVEQTTQLFAMRMRSWG
jgi:hypothetical protein